MMMMMMMMMMSNKTQIIFDIIKAMGNAGVQPRRATDEVVIKRIAARRDLTLSAFPHLRESPINSIKRKSPKAATYGLK
jgi:hypothetical protein